MNGKRDSSNVNNQEHNSQTPVTKKQTSSLLVEKIQKLKEEIKELKAENAILKDLVDCDFIRCYKGYNKKSKTCLYQLIDPFTLFYFKFINKYGTSEKPFWQYQIGTRVHDTWEGLAFEQLCLNNYKCIEKKLGISGIITNVYSWTSSKGEIGAQIDLIIKRADKVINICEMKYYDGEYVTQKKIRKTLKEK